MPHNGYVLGFLALAFSCGCSRLPVAQEVGGNEMAKPSPGSMAWPKDWSKHVGRQVTVEGVTVNRKIGAALYGDGEAIFIDGIHSWPDGLYLGGDEGRRVRVTGTVVERHDLPVFIPQPDKPVIQGIPLAEGTDLRQVSRRFFLQNAIWTAVE